jgi:uncharacterized lipoprotein YajG
MKAISQAALVLMSAMGLGLSGCTTPNIVLQPTLPAVVSSSAGDFGPISVSMAEAELNPKTGQYEEKGDKVFIGRSESLGAHISDFWVEEPPDIFVKRLLENDLKAWGFTVSADEQQKRLHGRVNKFSLDSRSINPFEFQADGVIDVDLEVSRASGNQLYKGHYAGTCTHRTATEMPNKKNMEKLFSNCLEEFQKRLQEDANLRSALASN